MRGLPPQPPDVLKCVFAFDVDGGFSSVQHWLFVPSLAAAGIADLEAIAGDLLLGFLPFFTSLAHGGARVASVTLESRSGVVPIIERLAPPNSGVWTGGQAAQVALGLHWLTGEGGALDHTVTHLPGFPDVFTDDHRRINALAWGNASASAVAFLNFCSTIVGPVGGTCLLGTVHRSSSGAPLGTATFAPFVGVRPVPRVATIRRRIGDLRSTSP